ncbi:MAG: outer membrane lipoprotein-sorting protein [Candidatus Latescibacteria bacterium]|nr:outer membrane lipoprotein-sorting protein [Candidatus Latescibacterota bacterium]
MPFISAILLAALLWSAPSSAEAPAAEDLARKSQLAFFYAGEDLKVKIHMRLVTRDGKERLRDLTMLRKDVQEGGEQKYFICFHQPADVRDMTFMVWKYPGKDDDRWLYMPALKLVRRIAADDKRSSFAGSDFTYEDVSGRGLEEDVYALIREENLDDKVCDVVKSTPKTEKGADYSYKLSWIDRNTFLPLKEEYYDRQGNLARVFTAGELKEVQGLPTIVRRTMMNLQTGHKTEVVFEEVKYNLGLVNDLFTERYLRSAPPEAK